MTRYFPEVVEAVKANLPGALRRRRRDRRPRPRAATGSTSRRCSSASTPPPAGSGCWPRRRRRSFVAFDLLALGDDDLTGEPFAERRAALEKALADASAADPPHPATTDRAGRASGSSEFEGAGLDGVVAKPLDGTYQPDKRVMFKIKHERTADCVVAGYRVHKSGPDADRVAAARALRRRGRARQRRGDRRLPDGAPPRAVRGAAAAGDDLRRPPVGLGAGAGRGAGPRGAPRAAAGTRGKDLSFVPLRPERVVEVRYDHMEGVRFRHTAQFVRWRPDRDPRSCTLRAAGGAGQLRPRRGPRRPG